jgi:hypothetical protein
MKCCACHGSLGLIRHRMLALTGYLVFCSKRYVDEYRKRIQEEVRKRKYQTWLQGDRNTP